MSISDIFHAALKLKAKGTGLHAVLTPAEREEERRWQEERAMLEKIRQREKEKAHGQELTRTR